ncbi:response regulator transcription factor [Miniphocaeibacter massiliensis]|uniref:response regulator transcription factor n=1 Tax=Miniphocaeibacter massiliensis TaxID=2041841 RepID=UPI000C1BE8AB|nr:response regulator transcription factor [Miniphocaeibacter massiliensis]
MITVGIVEDDKLLNEALCISLEKDGFKAIGVLSVKEGLELIEKNIDILLLDINLPDGLGFSISEKVKDIPIIFLTARDTEIDMIKAYDQGCEDYIVKPFSIEILKRRIHVVLRRIKENEIFEYKLLKIDYNKKQVLYKDKLIKLTAKEYKLLEYLSNNIGQVISKELILQEIWDIDGNFVVDNTVSVTINRLRKKIEPDYNNPIFIKNIFGMGYVFGE